MTMVKRNCTGTQCQTDREILDIFVGKNIDEQCLVGEEDMLVHVCMHNNSSMSWSSSSCFPFSLFS